jgi:radical SAM protein with 4Fe4S-binding SPASM domain
MITSKYNALKKARIQATKAFPFLRHASFPLRFLKIRRFRKRVAEREKTLAESLRATGSHPLFNLVEIETINRCNGECGFCPVNKHLDPRKPMKMPDGLFSGIIAQLAEMRYSGSLYLYSNNEPLLDTRITGFVREARRMLPGATLGISSNGLLLNENTYREIIDSVDFFTVNNYTKDFQLLDTHKKIQAWAASNPDWDRKTRIDIRYINEVMTSRGGNSPNKQHLPDKKAPYGCTLPTHQIVIRPDGKLSLCCNDALGSVTMGDAARDRLLDIWNGDAYRAVREKLLSGRDAFPVCRHCDVLQGRL